MRNTRGPDRRPLWTCPRCGHQFVTRNLWHSCSRHTLAEHFTGKPPRVREMFDRFVSIVERFGPVTVYAQKSRIICQVRVRFAGAVPARDWLDTHLWLKRRAAHPRLRRIELIPPDNYVHTFRFDRAEQLDEAFAALVEDAAAIGRQEHGAMEHGVRPGSE
jgi:Domain of unknown function (DUF5655)